MADVIFSTGAVSKEQETHLVRRASRWYTKPTPDMSSQIRLVVFFLELPEPLAIVDLSTFALYTDESMPELTHLAWAPTADHEPNPLPEESVGKAFVSIRILQIDESSLTRLPPLEATFRAMRRVLPQEQFQPKIDVQQEPPLLYEYRTVVEAVTPLRWDDDAGSDELSTAFDRCEMYLARLFDAYRTVAGRMIPPFRRELLPPMVPFMTRDFASSDEIKWLDGGLFLLHHNVSYTEETLGPEAMKKLQILTSHIVVGGHAFASYSLRSKEAAAALNRYGDTVNTLILGQIAVEVLLDGLLTSMLWEEGVDPVYAAEHIFDQGLSKRVRTHYGSRIGGDWNTKGEGVMGQWSRNVAQLRGRVVHGNYTPSRAEAKTALATLTKMDSFVRRRLVISKNKYMRTTLMLLGSPGLEKLGAWSGKIRRFAKKEADEEPDWRISLNEWRGRLDEAR